MTTLETYLYIIFNQTLITLFDLHTLLQLKFIANNNYSHIVIYSNSAVIDIVNVFPTCQSFFTSHLRGVVYCTYRT